MHFLDLLFQAAKYFFIDDVFVTGYLREKLNLTFIDSTDYQVGGNRLQLIKFPSLSIQK